MMAFQYIHFILLNLQLFDSIAHPITVSEASLELDPTGQNCVLLTNEDFDEFLNAHHIQGPIHRGYRDKVSACEDHDRCDKLDFACKVSVGKRTKIRCVAISNQYYWQSDGICPLCQPPVDQGLIGYYPASKLNLKEIYDGYCGDAGTDRADVKCTAESQWVTVNKKETLPTCLRREPLCPTVNNSLHSLTTHNYKMIQCKPEYDAYDLETRTKIEPAKLRSYCTAVGWKPRFECKVITCTLAQGELGKQHGYRLRLGNTGTFQCDNNYFISGKRPGDTLSTKCTVVENKAVFDTNGASMKCKPISQNFCAAGSLPEAYKFESRQVYYGKDVTVSLKCGDERVHKVAVSQPVLYDEVSFKGTCKVKDGDAVWDIQDACIKKAEIPCTITLQGISSGETPTLGQSQTFYCNENEGIITGQNTFLEVTVSCELDNGFPTAKLNGQSIVALDCQPIVCKLGPDAVGKVNGGNELSYARSGKYQCNGPNYVEGKAPGVPLETTCKLIGNEPKFDNADKMKCLPVKRYFCATSSLKKKGYVYRDSGRSYVKKGESVKLKCDQGFTYLSDNGYELIAREFDCKCNEDIDWQYTAQCIDTSDIKCSRIEMIGEFDNAVDKEPLALGSSITFSCASGHSLQDSGNSKTDQLQLRCTINAGKPQYMNGDKSVSKITCLPPTTTTSTTTVAPTTEEHSTEASTSTVTTDYEIISGITNTGKETDEFKTDKSSSKNATSAEQEQDAFEQWVIFYGYGSAICLILFVIGLRTHMWWGDRKWTKRVRKMEQRGLRLGREELRNSGASPRHGLTQISSRFLDLISVSSCFRAL